MNWLAGEYRHKVGAVEVDGVPMFEATTKEWPDMPGYGMSKSAATRQLRMLIDSAIPILREKGMQVPIPMQYRARGGVNNGRRGSYGVSRVDGIAQGNVGSGSAQVLAPQAGR